MIFYAIPLVFWYYLNGISFEVNTYNQERAGVTVVAHTLAQVEDCEVHDLPSHSGEINLFCLAIAR